jgi:TATA-box binding protein (TBP) (component of TFIID and TFIIIB)
VDALELRALAKHFSVCSLNRRFPALRCFFFGGGVLTFFASGALVVTAADVATAGELARNQLERLRRVAPDLLQGRALGTLRVSNVAASCALAHGVHLRSLHGRAPGARFDPAGIKACCVPLRRRGDAADSLVLAHAQVFASGKVTLRGSDVEKVQSAWRQLQELAAACALP